MLSLITQIARVKLLDIIWEKKIEMNLRLHKPQSNKGYDNLFTFIIKF
jgi:hypothetical protein